MKTPACAPHRPTTESPPSRLSTFFVSTDLHFFSSTKHPTCCRHPLDVYPITSSTTISDRFFFQNQQIHQPQTDTSFVLSTLPDPCSFAPTNEIDIPPTTENRPKTKLNTFNEKRSHDRNTHDRNSHDRNTTQQEGKRVRFSPICTLSQNGYGAYGPTRFTTSTKAPLKTRPTKRQPAPQTIHVF